MGSNISTMGTQMGANIFFKNLFNIAECRHSHFTYPYIIRYTDSFCKRKSFFRFARRIHFCIKNGNLLKKALTP